MGGAENALSCPCFVHVDVFSQRLNSRVAQLGCVGDPAAGLMA